MDQLEQGLKNILKAICSTILFELNTDFDLNFEITIQQQYQFQRILWLPL